MTPRIGKLIARLQTAFKILTSPNTHWFIVYINEEELKKSLSRDNFSCSLVAHGLQQYNVMYAIKQLAAGIDPDELVLMRAEFEAKSETIKNQ